MPSATATRSTPCCAASAASSDGKGKGITAPNPIGQKLVHRARLGERRAVAGHRDAHRGPRHVHPRGRCGGSARAWRTCSASLQRPGRLGGARLGEIEHRASERRRRRGRNAENGAGAARQGAAAQRALRASQSRISISRTAPLYVNTELQPWTATADGVRRAGVSAFGFGGTNFHAVLEEYIPHRLERQRQAVGGGRRGRRRSADADAQPILRAGKAPLRGALVIGAASEAALAERLRAVQRAAEAGRAPAPAAPAAAGPARAGTHRHRLCRRRRSGGQSGQGAQGAGGRSAGRVEGAARAGHLPRPRPRAQGGVPLYRARARSTSTCCEPLRAAEPIVAETFAEADRVMTPLLGQAAQRVHFRGRRPTPQRWPRPKRICARPRSRSRPCWPSISR